AAQLLPFLQLLSLSQRQQGLNDASWAMPVWGLGNFFVPIFRCFQSMHGVFSQEVQQWTSSYYLPLGAVALGFFAIAKSPTRRAWLLVCAALAGVLLALGDATPLWSLGRHLFPPLAFMRFPIKLITVTIVAIPLLEAFGARHLS